MGIEFKAGNDLNINVHGDQHISENETKAAESINDILNNLNISIEDKALILNAIEDLKLSFKNKDTSKIDSFVNLISNKIPETPCAVFGAIIKTLMFAFM